MNKNWILDASPIIILEKAGLLETVSTLAKTWMIPEAVIREIEEKAPIKSYLNTLSHGAKIIREKVSDIDPSIALWNLGQGESEVLTLALKEPLAGVVLDDLQARSCATLFDIPLIGTLGLVVLAKRKGVLALAKPAIDRLISGGLYINPVVLNQILDTIGEGK